MHELQLKQYLVGQDRLHTLHYIPDFITAAEEQQLLQEVHASKAKWVQLSGRRLQNHGGIVHSKGLIPAPLPGWLQALTQRVAARLPALFPADGVGPPNHVLINAYQPGCGIMPHEDGPLYHPVVAILSCGSPAVLRFWAKAAEGGTAGRPPVASLLAGPRSLLVFADDAYVHCLHGIDEVSEELLDESVVNPEAAAGLVMQQQQQQQQQQCQVPQQAGAQQHRQPHACAIHSSATQQLGVAGDPAATAAAGEGGAEPAAAAAQEGMSGAAGAGPRCSPPQQCGSCSSDGAAHAAPCLQQQLSGGAIAPACCCVADLTAAGGTVDVAAGAAAAGVGAAAAVSVLPRSGERVSFTIRRVTKTHKALGAMLGRRG